MARIFRQQGERLILVGRRPLDTLTDPLFTADVYCQADLSLPDSHRTIHQWLTERGVNQIDLLIHNAGIGWVGPVADQTPAEIAEMVQVNLKAPVAITHTLFKQLELASGKIVFVSSVVSQLPLHKYAVYVATKAALDGFARSLAVETSGRIAVQVLHPGAANTAMHAKVGTDEAVYRKYPSAESVAADMVRAMGRRKRHIAIGATNKLMRSVSLGLPLIFEKAMRQKAAESDQAAVKPHTVVTGGADGIGAAVARRFAAAGHTVTILDVDAELGQAVTASIGANASFIQVDLSDLDSVQDAVQQLARWSQVSTLVNNAGISAAGKFEQLPLEQMLKVIDINLTGALVLTTTLMRQDRLANQHQQVYLSSLSKYVGYPGAAVYAASKDGLAAFAKTMQAAAVANSRVTTVFPGPTRTAHARRYSPDNSREDKRMSPEAVAEAIYEGAMGKRRLVFPGAGAKVFAIFGRLLPRTAERAMKKTIYDKL